MSDLGGPDPIVDVTVDTSKFANELSTSLVESIRKSLQKGGIGPALVRQIINPLKANLPKELGQVLGQSVKNVVQQQAGVAQKAGEQFGQNFGEGMSRGARAAATRARHEQEALARDIAGSAERIATEGTKKANQVRLSENAKVRREVQRTAQAELEANAKIQKSSNQLAATVIENTTKTQRAQARAASQQQAQIQETTRVQLASDAKIQKSVNELRQVQVKAQADIAQTTIKQQTKVQLSSAQTARQQQTNATRLAAQQQTTIQRGITAASRLQAAQLKVQESRNILAARRQGTVSVIEGQELARIGQQSRLISGADKLELEKRRRNRQLEVAEVQQSEKRRSERLRQFNRISFLLVQTGLNRLRDVRRSHDISERSEQESSLRKEEINLKQSFERRQQITRQESRIIREQAAAQARATRQQASAIATIEQRTQGGVIGALRGTSVLGRVVQGAGLFAGFAGIRSALSASQEFFGSLRRLGALTQATDEEMQQLRDTAIALGNDIKLPGVSAADAAVAMSSLAQTGFTVQQSVDNARAVLALGRTQMIDFGEAARFVGAQVNAFGISAAESLGLIDDATTALVEGGGQSFTELQQAIEQSGSVFASTFKNVAGGAQAFEDLNVALAILAKNALRGSDAGTSLRTFILRLTSPQSDDASDLLQEMADRIGLVGSFAFDSQGKVRPFIEIIKNLRRATADLNEESRTRLFTEVFGQDAIRAANIFFQTTDEGLAEMQSDFANNAGTVDRLSEAVNKGLKGALDNLSSQLETIGILIFEKLEKPLAAAVNTFAGLISNLVSGEGIFGLFRTGLLGAGISLGSLAGFKLLGELIRSVILPGLAALASPMGLLISGIGLLGAGFTIAYQKSQPFRDAIGQVGKAITDDVLPALELIGRTFIREVLPALSDLAGAFLGLFGADGVIPRTTDKASENAGFFGEAMSGVANFITTVVVPAIETFSRVILTRVSPILSDVADFIRGPFTAAVKGIPDVLGGLGGILANFGGLVKASVGLAVDEIRFTFIPALQDLAENVRLGFSGEALGASARGFMGVLQTIAQQIGVVADAIRDIILGRFDFGGAIKDLLMAGFTGLGDLANFVGRQITIVFSEPVLKTLAGLAIGVAAVAADIAVNFLIGFAQGLKGRVDDIARVIRDLLGLALQAGLKAVFASDNILVDILVGGLLGVFTIALTGAGAAKLMKPFVTFFKSGGFKTLGRLIHFDIAGALALEEARATEQFKKQLKSRSQDLVLRRTLTGRVLIPIRDVDNNVRAVANTINSIPGRVRQLPTQMAGVIGRIQNSFANLSAAAQNSSTNIQVAFAAAGAAISGNMLASANNATEVFASLTGIATSVAAGFAIGNAPGAIIAGIGAAAGTAFGLIQRGAADAVDAIGIFKDAFADAGDTVLNTFASAISVATQESDKLKDSLRESGVNAEEASSLVLKNAQAFIDIQKLQKQLVDERIAAETAGGLGEVGISPEEQANLDRMQAHINEVADSLAKVMGVTREAVLALVDPTVSGFQVAVDSLDDVAAGFSTTGEAAKRFFDDIKRSSEPAEFREALLRLIPNEVESAMALLGINVDNMLRALKAGGTNLLQFERGVANAGRAAGLSEEEIKDLLKLLHDLGIVTQNATSQTDDFVRSQRAIDAREAHLEEIKDEWQKVRDSVSEAQDRVAGFFDSIRTAASEGSIENFAVDISNQLATLRSQLTDDQQKFGAALFDPGIIGDQTKINVARFGEIFREHLRDALTGVDDPAQVQKIIEETRAKARGVLEAAMPKNEQGELTAEGQLLVDTVVNTFQLPPEAVTALQDQVKAQALTAKITEVIPPDVLPTIPVKAVIQAIDAGNVNVGQLLQFQRTGIIRAPVSGGLARAREGGIWEQPGYARVFRDTRQRIMFNEPETGGEAFIPLGHSRRTQSVGITRQVAHMFGYELLPVSQTQGGSSVDLKGVDKFERAVDRIVNHEPPARVIIDQNIHGGGTIKRRTHRATVRALRNGSYLGWMR